MDFLQRLVALLCRHFRRVYGLDDEKLLCGLFAHLKHTAVRALSELLDYIEVIPGRVFNHIS